MVARGLPRRRPEGPSLQLFYADFLLRPFVERHRDHGRPKAAATTIDLEVGAARGVIDWHVGHADRLLQYGVCVPLVTTPAF